MYENQDASIKVPNPSTFPIIDLYLEKPASFFGLYRNDIAFTDVTSKLCIFNVGPLHVSFEMLRFKKRGGTPSGGFQNEVDDKSTSGDGDFHH